MTTQSLRAPLEILKFLTPKELLSISLLSHFWYRISETDELWLSFLSPCGLQAWPCLKYEGCRAKEAYRKIHSPFVAMVRGRRLLLYHFANSEWQGRDLDMPGVVSDDIVLTNIGDGLLFAYSSSNLPSNTFRISIYSGHVDFLPRTRLPRLYPGLIRHETHVFSFCGKTDPASSRCEKFNLSTEAWEAMPNSVYPRHAFNPIVSSGQIYLPHGNCPYIEVFSPTDSVFSPIKLKSNVVSSAANVVFDGKLVSFGIGKGLIFDFLQQTHSEFSLSKRPLRAWSSFDPVLDGNTAVLTWAYSENWMVALVDLKSFQCKTIEVPTEEVLS